MGTMTYARPHSRAVTILGREPAALLGFVEALLFLGVAAFAAYGGNDLDGDIVVASVMAVVSAAVGVYTAVATKDKLLGAITGLGKASINFALFLGLDLPMELQAAILSALAMGVGFFQRTQTSPVAKPVDPSPQQVTESPLESDPLPGGAVPGRPDHLGNHTDLDGNGIPDRLEDQGGRG